MRLPHGILSLPCVLRRNEREMMKRVCAVPCARLYELRYDEQSSR